jgi:hypothetical protein
MLRVFIHILAVASVELATTPWVAAEINQPQDLDTYFCELRNKQQHSVVTGDTNVAVKSKKTTGIIIGGDLKQTTMMGNADNVAIGTISSEAACK